MTDLQKHNIKNSIPFIIGDKYTDITLPLLRLLIALFMTPVYLLSKPSTSLRLSLLAMVFLYIILTCILPSFRNMIGKYHWLRIIVDDIIILAFCNTVGGLHSPYIYLFYIPVLINTINTGYLYFTGVMLITVGCFITLGLINNSGLPPILPYISGILIIGFFFKIILDKDFHVLSRYAIRDGLTGLYTHRYFYEQLRLQIDNHPAYPISLIMIDLNEFKRLNDELGHLKGDQVLKGVAAAIQRTVRDTDLVARYGGDEFAIVLPGVSQQVCSAKVEQIRKAIINLNYFTDVAIGSAQYPDDANNISSLVEIADKRMYHQKRMQQNRTFINSLHEKYNVTPK